MAKLNQIIAIEKGVKSRVYGEISALNKAVQKPELFNGFSKTYQKKDEDGEDFPPEKKRVQMAAEDVLSQAERNLTELIDVTARKDWTNCVASADVVVDGKTLFEKAPVTFLLFLEKQLTDLRTFVGNLPTLDEGDDWQRDENSGLFKTSASQTHRTRKAQKALVLYPATEHHPAQTQLITEDVLAGFWNTVKQSGALPTPRKQDILTRVEKLLQAVKQAREEANGCDEVSAPNVGQAVFGYVLGR